MGCSSTKEIDDSQIWINIQSQLPSQTTRVRANTSDSVQQSKVDGSKSKRSKTYFEPCMLYVNEPGHKNYHLNDLGLYEQDIKFTTKGKTSTHQKRPKCSGLWQDDSFDETKLLFRNEVKLLRPKEIHPQACILVDLIEERNGDTIDTECNNFMVNVLLLATDLYLLQRVQPNFFLFSIIFVFLLLIHTIVLPFKVLTDDYSSTKKYDGIFHCRFCRFGIWEDVYIDDRLPVGDNGFIYGSSSKEYNEIWIPLVKKAYAKFGGTYEAIRRRRFLEVFRTLTGGTGVEIQVSDKKFDPVYIGNKIDLALQQGSWVVCSVSKSSDGDFSLIYGQVFIIKAILKVETKRGKEVMLARMRNPIGDNEWTGPWSERSSEWGTAVCNQRPLLSDHEFCMSVDSLIKYMNCITICNLIPEQDKLGTEERSNYTTKIYSEWKGGMAAGLDYLKNPKYLINISDKGIEDDGKVRVVIILEQITLQTSMELVAIKTKLYKVHTECKHGMIIEDITEEGICSKRISVILSIRVVPGKYLVVPHTDREEFEKDFMIAIYTPTPLKGVRFIDERNPILVSRQGTTVKLKGATSECKLDSVNYSWGEWDLHQGYLHGEEFEKNPQFEIKVPNEAPSCVVRFQLLKDSFQEDACIGFRLFKMTSYRKMPLTKSWIDAIWDDPVKCHDGSIEGWHWDYIAPTYTLAPGTYIAIAWADKPDYKCSFCLVVRVSFPIEVTCYNGGNSA